MAGRKPGWSTAAQEIVDRVFVYGTLREGHAARSMMENHVERTEPATTTGRIYEFDGYPGLVESSDHRVVGDLLFLSQLTAAFALIDAYEGDDFHRILKKVRIEETGEESWSWCYVLADPTLATNGNLIESGDWVLYDRDR